MWKSALKKKTNPLLPLKRAFPRVQSETTINFSTTAKKQVQQQRNGLKKLSCTKYTRQLLGFMKNKEDMDEYLKVYGRPGVQRTAVIKIGGEVLENEMNVLVQSLIFLKQVGLFPILVHGAGPQMNKELEKMKIEPQYVAGNRVTDKDTLAVAKKVFLKANCSLVDALIQAGVNARPITSGVFEAQIRDFKSMGFVGEVSTIHSDSVYAAIDADQIPVLSSLGESHDGQLLNINADVAARELAISLQPYKTIFINTKGGWIERGEKLKQIDMSRDYKPMSSQDYTGRQGTLLKLNEINTLLHALPKSSSVVLTSASALSLEVLSSCSSGTVCIRGNVTLSDNNSPISFTSSSNKKHTVGLLGARGYVGRELIRLIGQHPELDLVCASSRALIGEKVLDFAQAPPLNPHTNEPAIYLGKQANEIKLYLDPELEFCAIEDQELLHSSLKHDIDVWVLALPNGYSTKYVESLDHNKKHKQQVILDLSADQRFHTYPLDQSSSTNNLSKQWIYGLPEHPLQRSKLKHAKYISNPGCYATGAQLGLLPLLFGSNNGKLLLHPAIPPHVFGVSGYSGAGTSPGNANNETMLHDNIMAYKSVQHIHEKEISQHLQTNVSFMPHVGSFFQGIHLTLSCHVQDKSMTAKDILAKYQEFYANEPLVHVNEDNAIPFVSHNAGCHHVTIGGIQMDQTTGRVVVIVTIDNLLKGAATQAIQNMNLALHVDEYVGIL